MDKTTEAQIKAYIYEQIGKQTTNDIQSINNKRKINNEFDDINNQLSVLRTNNNSFDELIDKINKN